MREKTIAVRLTFSIQDPRGEVWFVKFVLTEKVELHQHAFSRKKRIVAATQNTVAFLQRPVFAVVIYTFFTCSLHAITFPCSTISSPFFCLPCMFFEVHPLLPDLKYLRKYRLDRPDENSFFPYNECLEINASIG